MIVLQTTAQETAAGFAIIVMAGVGNAVRGSSHPGHLVRAVLQMDGALVIQVGDRVLAVYSAGTYVASIAEPERQVGLGLTPVPDVARRAAQEVVNEGRV